MFLHHLAKIEIYAADSAAALTPTLAILEEKAITEDLPGIQGQVLLLKIRLAMMNEDEALLRENISQLRSLIEDNNLRFLKSYLEDLLSRL
jgi:cob(I)alamin adenosyltransferase